MKKLLFAIAGAASFAALAADPATGGSGDISWVGFENYTADQTVVGYGDDGSSGNTLWSATGDDASLVKAYAGGEVAAPNIKGPDLFANASENTQYLALDTNGAELQRAIPADGQAIAADGTYIDTLVQFTPSESAPTSTDLTGAKLAIWLGVVENVTNLYVQGGFLNGPVAEGTPTIDTEATQAYKLGNIQVEPGQWYRLTVKAVKLDDDGAGNTISGFQIFVDGTLAVSDTAVADAAGIQYYTDFAEESGVFPGAAGLLSAKTLIPSCAGVIEDATLTSVGFKGTGALDDFVVTTAAPDFTPAAIDFQLTWPAGLTAVSYQIGENEPVAITGTSPFAVPGLAAGDVVKFIVANADGARKTFTGTAGTDTGLDATGTTFGWPEYLGEAVAGAYEIDDAAELVLFQKGVAAGLTTASTTFKLTDDVTLTAPWPGIGLPNGKDNYNKPVFTNEAFKGTFDGQNHTISGFQMVGVAGNPAGGNEGLDYCGFFNSTLGATIENFKIAYAGSLFAADTTKSTKESGATFVGVAHASTLRNLTTVSGTVSCSKGFGGISGYTTGGTVVEYCTNNVNMTSLALNKCGGIAMITQGGSGSAIIRNCQNNGTIAGSSETGSIVGYIGLSTTIADCESTVAYKLMHRQSGTVTVQGTNKGLASVLAYSNATNLPIDGLAFATVDGNVATFVKVADFAMGNTYKVTGTAAIETTPTYRPGAIATFNFTAAGTIAFDTSLAVPTWNVTADEGLDLTYEDVNNVRTYTAAAPQQAGWVDDSTTVSNDTAAAAYPALADGALANANAGKLTDWAKSNSIAFADVVAAPDNYVEAFMLNCAVAEVANEKAAFKLNISFDSEGNPVVTTPEGKVYNVTPQLKGANSLTGEWTPVSAGSTSYQFYKAVLSL